MAMIAWWGERAALASMDGIDLARGLGQRTPRMGAAPATFLATPRPRWTERVWRDEIPEETLNRYSRTTWDAAKEAFGRGELPAQGPWRPERG